MLLVLALVLRLGVLKGKVGHGIPGVVNTDEQEQNRSSSDDQQCKFPLELPERK